MSTSFVVNILPNTGILSGFWYNTFEYGLRSAHITSDNPTHPPTNAVPSMWGKGPCRYAEHAPLW